MRDRARSPRHHRPHRDRRAPQTWPLRAPRRRGCHRLLTALGLGAGAALLTFAVVLLLGSAVIA